MQPAGCYLNDPVQDFTVGDKNRCFVPDLSLKQPSLTNLNETNDLYVKTKSDTSVRISVDCVCRLKSREQEMQIKPAGQWRLVPVCLFHNINSPSMCFKHFFLSTIKHPLH